MTLQMNYQEKYEQGIEQGNKQSALRMIEAGKLSPEEIALYSGLILEQVLELDNDNSIPDFWTECSEKNLIEPMKLLRAEGKRDLYGLCSSVKDGETHFNYGIGVLIDENTDTIGLEEYIKNGYSIWKTEPADYVVCKCFGSDGNCLCETWSKFFKEFVPQTGYTQTDDTDYDFNRLIQIHR